MIQKKSLKDAIQNSEIISVVGGLLQLLPLGYRKIVQAGSRKIRHEMTSRCCCMILLEETRSRNSPKALRTLAGVQFISSAI